MPIIISVIQSYGGLGRGLDEHRDLIRDDGANQDADRQWNCNFASAGGGLGERSSASGGTGRPAQGTVGGIL